MIKKGRVFFGAVATFVILGVDCLVESKHSVGLATKTESLLAAGLPGELKTAQAQNQCERSSRITPAKETRKIKDDKFYLSFDIPTNYRNEKTQDDKTLMIILNNPADTKLLECCKRIRQFDCGYGTLPVWVKVEPATSETRLIPELSSTTLRLENIRETTIAKQKAFVYITKSSLTGNIDDADTYLTASFFSPDRRNNVTISTRNFGRQNIGSVEQKVFNLVVSSFAFVK
ncbi:hypothetical protein [Microcoleus sp. CAWBG58]|uniref:hypothetical protein n=1 Tax=Microcoleus sp. CAWBG58 TaxID=2841651 RepID=UPI0025ED4E05|nr:hypothetical protein [Microcoleus sp. CAWBG58]